MSCPVHFLSGGQCFKSQGVTLHEVEVYDLSNTIVGTFQSATTGVLFALVNQTAFDYAALFTGNFDDSVECDETGLPDRTTVRYRTTDSCGVGDWTYTYIYPPSP